MLCHPASVDSLSTSAAQEDHVSMGGFAARKALQVVKNVEHTVAVELLCAVQGIDLLKQGEGLELSPPMQGVYDLVRSEVPFYGEDRYMTPDIEAVQDMLKAHRIWDATGLDACDFA